MAENPIQHNDIIEIDKTIAGIKAIVKELVSLQKTIKNTAKTLISFQNQQNVATPGGRQATKETASDVEKLVQKNKKLEVSIKDLTKEQVRLQEVRRKSRRELKQQVQIEQTATGSLDNMRARLNQMTAAYNKATPAIRNKMAPAIKKLTKDVEKGEQAIGKHQRNVGNYPKVFQVAGKAVAGFAAGIAGATAIVQGMARGIKNSISTIINFDAAMSDVQAITRATDVEIGMLRNSAKALGGSTKFTASEVAALQKELGKLGFTVDQILSGTGGILALAAATGEDLARSAEVAGSTVRAFGLDASDTKDVVDIMTSAFSGSALNLERFAVSMRTVGPVAKAFGFNVAETTALLGSLANAGFDASMAGTATRNILLNLADSSGALAQKLGGAVTSFDELIPALIVLRESGVDLNETLELTDKRSVAAFNRFLEGAEFTREFADELDRAKGTADEMSEVQLDNLKGDLTILKSAFEGLVITVKDNNEGMNDTARGGVKALTQGLVSLKDASDNSDATWRKISKSIRQVVFAILEPSNGLLSALRLLKDEEIELDEVSTGVAETENRIAIIERQRAEQAVIKAAQEKAEIERKQRLLNIAIQQRAEDEFKSAADQKLIESQESKVDGFDLIQTLIDKLRSKEESLDNAEIQRADNILKADQKFTNQHIRNLEEQNKKEKESAEAGQKISLGQSIAALAQGLANTVKAGFPINIPLVIGYLAQTAGIISTIKAVKFERGGHGELEGPSHSRGGIPIPGIGEAQGKEYFGIINKQMTAKYKNDLPAIFDSLNAGKFHDIWNNANIQLQTQVDPWTKKIYDTLQSQPSIYTDSHGDTVKEYPNGDKTIIRKR